MFKVFVSAATLVTIAIAALAVPQRSGESPGAIPVVALAPGGYNITSLGVNGSEIDMLPPHLFVQHSYRFVLFGCGQEVSPPRRAMEGVNGLSIATSQSVPNHHQLKLEASA
ncbi:hypothetical protein CVT25_002248 [Psilocybe cyanescens]|uniref:Uncharacterized protein n=1 Tax=Psilocybe cyanescens TaxID=93625 RepID=A0A409X5J1_PSICY|nr:hypothetical protein CVT25_002248 [Psilocybe cyanescens]